MAIMFESVWLLLTVAGVALVAASIVRQVKPEWGYWPLLVPVAVVGLAFAMDAAVTTDPEAVHGIIASCKQAAINGDAKSLMAVVSPSYTDRSHRDRAALEAAAQRMLSKAAIKKIKTQSFLLTFQTGAAEGHLNVVVHLNKNSQYAAMGSIVFVELKLDFEKIGEKWYLSRAELVSVNNDPTGWRDLP